MPGTSVPEFDLHGAVGIRLLDAAPGDLRAVVRQLGPLRSTLEREPDIVIRFVERMPLDGPVRYLGLDEAAYGDDRYVVLRGRHKASVRVAIPLAEIGTGPFELIAERGLSAVPLLVQIVNLTAFGNGWLPLHAGAFVHDGLGVLTLGWSKGGKSETLLAFTARGAAYVGDEWIYVDPATGRMTALPEPMRVWDWQIRAVPGLAEHIPSGDRRRLAAGRAASATLRGVGDLPVVGDSALGRLATRLRVPLERQMSVQVPPARLLGRDPLPDGAPLDRTVVVTSHASDDVVVAKVDGTEVAGRATHSFLFELADLLGHYRRFRFAYPDRRNGVIEDLEASYERRAVEVLAGVPAIAVHHPYPPEIDSLYEAIAPALV
jgi:hypothetical protein